MIRSKNTIGWITTAGILIFLASVNISCGQEKSTTNVKVDKANQIDSLVKAHSELGKFNGSVLVAEKGEILYKGGFGLANMDWDIPNQPNTKFRLASISKQFTAMIIVQLVAENQLDLHVPISTYLPNYPKNKADVITIHHLLTHTSGTPDYGAFPNYKDFERKRFRPEEIVDLFSNLPLEFEPGKQYNYSNSGYVLLGVIIENITGNSFADVLHEKILTPLEMNDTGYENNWEVVKNKASTYAQNWGDYYNATYLDMSLNYTAGAMYSTVEDMYLWDQALYTDQLLPEEYRDLIFKPHIVAGSRYYGYGWFIDELSVGNSGLEVPIVSHGGGMDGVRTLITRIPSEKSSIILLNNVEVNSIFALTELTIAINGILHDQPYEFPRKSLAKSMMKVIEADGLKEGLSFFKEFEYSNDFYLDENELIKIGYDLLHSDRAEESAAVFQLATQAFPSSYNVFDSYAEALKTQGKNQEAIENYKKSIELFPGNRNGLDQLSELGVDIEPLIRKVPLDQLKVLEGTYEAINESGHRDVDWVIVIEEVDRQLVAHEKGLHYELLVGKDLDFFNQRYGISFSFDVRDKKDISFLSYGNVTFKKIDSSINK